VKRAKNVLDGLVQGRFQHVDIGIYTLHIHACRRHIRRLLNKSEVNDCLARLKIIYPLLNDGIPALGEGKLPKVLHDMAVGTYKVEWFYAGEYKVARSPDYKVKLGHPMKNNIRNMHPKTIDTMGFSQWDMPMKMWMESLYRPGQVVSFGGVAFHVNRVKIQYQVARMMSIIFDYEHVITVTQIV
jgi:hypothetical protein